MLLSATYRFEPALAAVGSSRPLIWSAFHAPTSRCWFSMRTARDVAAERGFVCAGDASRQLSRETHFPGLSDAALRCRIPIACGPSSLDGWDSPSRSCAESLAQVGFEFRILARPDWAGSSLTRGTEHE